MKIGEREWKERERQREKIEGRGGRKERERETERERRGSNIIIHSHVTSAISSCADDDSVT